MPICRCAPVISMIETLKNIKGIGSNAEVFNVTRPGRRIHLGEAIRCGQVSSINCELGEFP
jgi:hypothetical protein